MGNFIAEMQILIRKNKQLEAKLAESQKESKRLREEHRWIPVSERLPKKSGLYQVIKKNNSRMPATTEYDKQDGWEVLDPVTHWKPIVLPKQALRAGGE